MDILKELGLYDELPKMAAGPPKENTGLSRILVRIGTSPSITPFKSRSEFQKV